MSESPSSSARWLQTADIWGRRFGQSVAWLLLFMMLVQCLVVLLRYGFEVGSIALQESVTYLHACAFMLGAAYTLQTDSHVRVDLLYRNWPARRQAVVNIAGTLLLLLPFSAFIVVSSIDYVQQSWAISERSADSGGLPIVYVLKTLIPLLGASLFLQGLVELLRNGLVLRDARPEVGPG